MDSIAARALEAALMRARDEVLNHLTVQQLLVFIAIHSAGPGGVEQGTLAARFGMTRSNVYKIVSDLSERTSLKAPGPSLVRSVMDPNDKRLRILTCTERGVAAMRRILGQ